jgi:hypothetical protein
MRKLIYIFAFLNLLHVSKSTSSEIDDALLKKLKSAKSFEDIFGMGKVISLQTSPEEYILFADQVKVSADKRIHIVDRKNNRIHVFDYSGKWIRSFGQRGQGPGELRSPSSLAFGNDGLLYVGDAGNQRIAVWDTSGNFVKTILLKHGVSDLFMLGSDSILVFTMGAHLVYLCDHNGNVLSSFGEWRDLVEDFMNKYRAPIKGGSFSVDSKHNIYFAYVGAYRIRKYSISGELVTEFGREADFFKPPGKPPTEMSPHALQEWNFSWTPVSKILAVQEGIIIVQIKTQQASGEYTSRLDFFDQNGAFISGGIRTSYYLAYQDATGNIYFVETLESNEKLEIKNPLLRRYRLQKPNE